MSDKITVLMSVYNGMPHLAEAVDSIVKQSLADFEFLIIDDQSDDGSREYIREIARKDKRIRLEVNAKRQGLGKNLKKGVELASGKWIARMDADDIAMADRLEKQHNFVQKYPQTDILGSYAIDIDEQGNEIGLRTMPCSHDDIVKYIWTCPIIHPTAFIKKDALLAIGNYGDEPRRQDYALWFRAAKSGLNFANLPEVLLKYRYADEYFKKNNLKALVGQAKIGWQGCKSLDLTPVAYIGVCVPLIKGIMPRPCARFVSGMISRFDPRRKQV